jgi:uncharacterized membrane protein
MESEERDEKLNALLAELDGLSRSVERQQRQLDRLRQEIRQLQTPSAVPVAPPLGVPIAVPPPAEPPTAEPSVSPRQSAGFGHTDALPEEPVAAPFRPIRPPAASSVPGGQSLEQYIGGNLINKVGILILVLGVGIFLNYAFENNLLGPVARISMGYVTGVALVGLAYWLKKDYPAYGAVLLSGGVSTLYFTTYFAYDFYGLLPHLLAFGLMVAVTGFTVYAAMQFDQQVIGVYGQVGAYAVPLLLSQGNGQVAVLFSYTAIINVGVAVLAFRKNWFGMNGAAFLVTWLTYGSWFFLSFEVATHLPLALGFGTLFWAIFYAVFAFGLRGGESVTGWNGVVLVLNAFVYYLLGYEALDGLVHERWQGLFTVAVAAAYAGVALYARRQGDRPALFSLALVLAVAFATIAVPVQLGGVSVTYVWAAEAVVLFAAGQRLRAKLYGYLAAVAAALTVLSLFIGWGAYDDAKVFIPLLLNRHFAVSLWVVLALGIMAWLARREGAATFTGPPLLVPLWRTALPVAGVVLLYGVVALEIGHYFEHQVTRLPPNDPSKLAVGTFWEAATRLRSLGQLWLITFAGLYVSALLALLRYLRAGGYWQRVPAGLSLLVLTAWLLGGLYAAETLRDAYLEGMPDRRPAYLLVRYLAYGGVGLCVGLAGQRVGQLGLARAGSPWQWYPAAVHVFIIAVLSAELVQGFVWMGGGPVAEWKEPAQKVGFSVLWGGYALALVGRGIWRKRKVLRLLGIALFAVTLVKLFLFDLGDISKLGKIIAFVGLGVLLLTISFLYQKFKDVILGEDSQ